MGLGIFAICMTLHVLLWRIYQPKRHLVALLSLFFLGGAVLFFALQIFFKLSFPDALAVALLHTALSCGYIQLYPASQAQSPSVTILTTVKKSMPHGMTENEIRSLLNTEMTFQDRVEDLMAAGLVQHEKKGLSLTKRGRGFILPFIYYRRMLGIPEGKG